MSGGGDNGGGEGDVSDRQCGFPCFVEKANLGFVFNRDIDTWTLVRLLWGAWWVVPRVEMQADV